MKGMKTLSLLLGSLLLPAVVFASSGGEGGEVEMVSFFSSNFFWAVVNFAIIVFLLVRYGKEPLGEALANRRRTIEKTLDEAAQAREKALEALAEAKKRLSEKDAAVESLIEDARKAAEREKERLVEQGERLSRDIVERARTSVDLELKRAKDELKAEAVQLALELAETKIRESVSEEDQRKLVTDYVERMESRN